MSNLIFCSFEVGGLPFKMAEILNRNGVETYYFSIHKNPRGYNSTRFHYGQNAPEWDLSHLLSGDFSRNNILKTLAEIRSRYDIRFCLATGIHSWLLQRAGIDYHYWVFGSDLDQDPFMPFCIINRPLAVQVLASPLLLARRINARKTLRASAAVMIAPYQQPAMELVSPGKPMFFFTHFMPARFANFDELLARKIEARNKLNGIWGGDRFFFSSTRNFWTGKRSRMSDHKGNDIIVKAYKAYIERTADQGARLILVNKGPDAASTRALAALLGLEELVCFVDEMRRDELDEYYLGADACFGQFGTPVLTNTVLEPLAFGTPCVSSALDGSVGVPYYREMPPIANLREPREIAVWLASLAVNAGEHNALMRASFEWIKTNCSEERFLDSFKGLSGP